MKEEQDIIDGSSSVLKTDLAEFQSGSCPRQKGLGLSLHLWALATKLEVHDILTCCLWSRRATWGHDLLRVAQQYRARAEQYAAPTRMHDDACLHGAGMRCSASLGQCPGRSCRGWADASRAGCGALPVESTRPRARLVRLSPRTSPSSASPLSALWEI